MSERFEGLCLNGPRKGERLVRSSPWFYVALLGELSCKLSPEPWDPPTIRRVEYKYVVNHDGDGDWWIVTNPWKETK